MDEKKMYTKMKPTEKATMEKSFHNSALGRFGGMVPQDAQGYCHTEPAGWLAAYGEEISDERAEEMAVEAQGAVEAAVFALVNWRAS